MRSSTAAGWKLRSVWILIELAIALTIGLWSRMASPMHPRVYTENRGWYPPTANAPVPAAWPLGTRSCTASPHGSSRTLHRQRRCAQGHVTNATSAPKLRTSQSWSEAGTWKLRPAQLWSEAVRLPHGGADFVQSLCSRYRRKGARRAWVEQKDGSSLFASRC